MAINIPVRQREVVLVEGAHMGEVACMYTLGLNPCIGLVLWDRKSCVMGHFDGLETIDQCTRLITHLRW